MTVVGAWAATPAHAIQARVTVSCTTSTGTLLERTFPETGLYGVGFGSTTPINFATIDSANAPNGIYSAGTGCRFEVIGTVNFFADVAKVGEFILNGVTITNKGTLPGTVNVFYRHNNTAADPTVRQCATLTASGYLYAGGASVTGDSFVVDEAVEYFKGTTRTRRFVVGNNTATVGLCNPSTGAVARTGGVLAYTAGAASFSPTTSPPGIYNEIPACPASDCDKGARILKNFETTLKPGHSLYAIATIRAGMAGQRSNNSFKEQELEAVGNQYLLDAFTSECARIDLKPGNSDNFVRFSGDQGMIVVDLFGQGPDGCLDIARVDVFGLRLRLGASGALTPSLVPVFYGEGALVHDCVYGDFNQDGYDDVRCRWKQGDVSFDGPVDFAQVLGTIFVNGRPTAFSAEDAAFVQ